MRPSPIALFVVGALALTAVVGVLAARHHEDKGLERPALPSDATTFGFVVRSSDVVPVLEATKPFRLALANGPIHGVPPLVRPRLDADAVLRAKIAELARRVATFDADAPRRLGLDTLVARQER